MTTIKITTVMNAPIDRCFDLARSIDLHLASTKDTEERVVAGRSAGLALAGETITWEAVHFGVRQQLSSKIMEMRPPYYFSDEMIKGAFKSMYHQHHFATEGERTIMTDVLNYETLYGIFGKLFNRIALHRHMLALLLARNAMIKNAAEGDGWINILQ